MARRVDLHPHAREQAASRGAAESEIIVTVQQGEAFPAKYGRTGFRRNFVYNGIWRGRRYATKQIEAFVVEEDGAWLVITVLVKFF